MKIRIDEYRKMQMIRKMMKNCQKVPNEKEGRVEVKKVLLFLLLQLVLKQ